MTMLTHSTSAEPVTSRSPATGPARAPERTPAGTALQLAWVMFLVYGAVMAAVQPDHPEPPGWMVPLFDVMSLAILATTAGLLVRRRWALWGSAGLALPMAGMAVFCILADAGAHWVAEVGFAAAVIGLSLHPGSWRMHTR